MTEALDPRLVFAKTPQGAEEIAQRKLGLSGAARRILILLDGQRRLMDLPPFARPGELDPIVEDLQARGLIALAGISEAPAEDLQRARLQLQRDTLDRLQRALAGRFERELSRDGLVLDARVRDCVSLDVMRQLLRDAVDEVATRNGEAAGERILEVIRPLFAEFVHSR